MPVTSSSLHVMHAVQAFVWLAQPQLESSLAAAERLVSKPEPLRCLWLRHLL